MAKLASMKKQKDTSGEPGPGNRSTAGAQSLTSYGVGAVPILDRVITRMKLSSFLGEFMVEDKRCTISPVSGTLVLLKNSLMSREPIYGITSRVVAADSFRSFHARAVRIRRFERRC